MKKSKFVLTIAIHLAIGPVLQAQWQYDNATGIESHKTGFAVIGNTTPLVKLAISGDANTERIHVISSQDPVVCMYHVNGSAAAPSPVIAGNYLGYYQFGGYDGTQNIRSAWITGVATQNWTATGRGAGIALCTTPNNSTTMTERVRIDENGSVGIGTMSPQAKLAVNGDILCKKVTVTLNGWADYVFNASYRLRPLSEVEQYIRQHHHLPEVVAAEEVEKNGVDIGGNQAALLKKIEELTLYAIEQEKQIKQLESLKKEVEDLKAMIREIKK